MLRKKKLVPNLKFPRNLILIAFAQSCLNKFVHNSNVWDLVRLLWNQGHRELGADVEDAVKRPVVLATLSPEVSDEVIEVVVTLAFISARLTAALVFLNQ